MSCSCKKQNDFDLGTTVRILGKLTMEDAATDADVVTLKVKRPDGSILSLAATHDGLGSYYRDVQTDLPGQWTFQWSSNSPGAVEEGSFIVRRSAFA